MGELTSIGFFESLPDVGLKNPWGFAEAAAIPRVMVNIFKTFVPIVVLTACGDTSSDSQPTITDALTRHVALNITGEDLLDVGVNAELNGCVSGFVERIRFPEDMTFRLVRGDRSCQLVVRVIQVGNHYFSPPLGSLPYDPSIGSDNLFVSAEGEALVVSPLNEIPSPFEAEHFALKLNVQRLDEGAHFSIKSSLADLVPRPGLSGWFSRNGKFTLDQQRGVAMWRSLLEKPDYFAQTSRENRPDFIKNLGVKFSGEKDRLNHFGQPTAGELSFAIGLTEIRPRKNRRNSIINFVGKERCFNSIWLLGNSFYFGEVDSGSGLYLGETSEGRATMIMLTDGKTMEVWINGQSLGPNHLPCGAVLVDSIGSNRLNGKNQLRSFEGMVYEVMHWTRKLSDDELSHSLGYLEHIAESL